MEKKWTKSLKQQKFNEVETVVNNSTFQHYTSQQKHAPSIKCCRLKRWAGKTALRKRALRKRALIKRALKKRVLKKQTLRKQVLRKQTLRKQALRNIVLGKTCICNGKFNRNAKPKEIYAMSEWSIARTQFTAAPVDINIYKFRLKTDLEHPS